MFIRTLTKPERERVYYDHILADIPPTAKKTFPYLEGLVAQGIYRCLGLFEAETLEGYAYLTAPPDQQTELLDFFAVCAGLRDRGVGGAFLRLLTDMERGVRSLTAEVEDPDFAEGTEKATRLRRIAFYERNGWADTGMRCRVEHYDTRIFCPGPAPASLREDLRQIYLATFGEDWLRDKIVLR